MAIGDHVCWFPYPIGSMHAIYGGPWIPSIYPLDVSINLPAPWIRHGAGEANKTPMVFQLRPAGCCGSLVTESQLTYSILQPHISLQKTPERSMICRSNTYPVQPVHDLDQSIDSDFLVRVIPVKHRVIPSFSLFYPLVN
jgi:hypothetical protein